VTSIQDILSLRDVGAAGAVVGTAIYTGKLNFRDAVEALKRVI
jgi:phosphoribosylformimino-5-aminoimidazole carboxamide ribotide isomerase